MRDPGNIRAVEDAGADMMGFICWDGPSRYVGATPASMPLCTKVGVFVNPTLQYISRMARALNLDAIQLHGNETPEFCQQARQRTGLAIIKAFGMSGVADLVMTESYADAADYFLFDTRCKCVGGSGRQFDWDILACYKGKTKFILSGGIGPGDAETLSAWGHPMCIGIDINSRFEDAPALKNVDKVREFISKMRGECHYKERENASARGK